jgi:hypothetical protein
MIFNRWKSTNINKIKSIDTKQKIRNGSKAKRKDIHIELGIPVDTGIVEESCVWKVWATLITIWKFLSRCSSWWLNVSMKQNNQKIKTIFSDNTLSNLNVQI